MVFPAFILIIALALRLTQRRADSRVSRLIVSSIDAAVTIILLTILITGTLSSISYFKSAGNLTCGTGGFTDGGTYHRCSGLLEWVSVNILGVLFIGMFLLLQTFIMHPLHPFSITSILVYISLTGAFYWWYSIKNAQQSRA
jgi:hypothetical protein